VGSEGDAAARHRHGQKIAALRLASGAILLCAQDSKKQLVNGGNYAALSATTAKPGRTSARLTASAVICPRLKGRRRHLFGRLTHGLHGVQRGVVRGGKGGE